MTRTSPPRRLRLGLRRRSGGAAIVVAVLVCGAGAVAARTTLPDTCRKGERLATGKAARALLRCHAKAAKRGESVDASCIDRLLPKLEKGFAKAAKKARRRGGCEAPGDAAATWTALGALADDLVALVGDGGGRSRCDAKRLAALGGEVQRLLKAKAKTPVPTGTKPLERERAASSERIAEALDRAARKDDCSAAPDVAAVVARVHRAVGTAGRLHGRIQAVKRVQFPPSSRADILATRADWEAMGFAVAEDGAWVEGPLVPAPGWLVTFGDARAWTDLLGDFDIEVPLGAPVIGEVFHPGNETEPIGPLTLAEVAGEVDAPASVLFEVRTWGACGMSGDPATDPEHCAELQAAPHSVRDETHRNGNPHPDVDPPIREDAFGTYPDNDPPWVDCLDYDGYLPNASDPNLQYIGSTCHQQVCLGCCDNELGDYRRFIGQMLRGRRVYAFQPVQDVFPQRTPCSQNHGGGRWCQQLRQGDVAVRVRGTIVHAEVPEPSESLGAALCFGRANPLRRRGDGAAQSAKSFAVAPGEVIEITVHNNGCHGKTHVTREPTTVALGGALTGSALGGDEIDHAVGATYVPDREVYYEAPLDCDDAMARDTFAFETDGARATIEFRCDTGVTLAIDFPPAVIAGVATPLRATVTRSDGAGGVVPLDGAAIELVPTDASAAPPTGVTDAQGEFSSQVTADAGSTSISVLVRALEQAGGSVLAEETVVATVNAQPTGGLQWRDSDSKCNFNLSAGVSVGNQFCNAGGGLGGSTVRMPYTDADANGCSRTAPGVGSASGSVAASVRGVYLTDPDGMRVGVAFDGSTEATGELILESATSSPYGGGYSTSTCTALFDVVGGMVPFTATGQVSSDASGEGMNNIVEVVLAVSGTRVFAVESGEVSESGMLAEGSYAVSYRIQSDAGVGPSPATASASAAVTVELRLGVVPPTTSTTTTSTSSSTSTSATTVSTTSSTATISTSTTSSTTTTVSTTTTTSLPGGGGTFYRSYAATGPDGPSIMLTDAIRSETVDLGTAIGLLVPASLDGSLVTDPTAYLTCYDLPGSPFAGSADIGNVFGTQTLALADPVGFCAAESVVLAPVDDLACYGVAGASVGQSVTIAESFNSETVAASSPTLLCLPVAVDGGGISNPAAAVTCYATTTTGTTPGIVPIDNRFGDGSVDVGLPTGVCVPTVVTSIMPAP